MTEQQADGIHTECMVKYFNFVNLFLGVCWGLMYPSVTTLPLSYIPSSWPTFYGWKMIFHPTSYAIQHLWPTPGLWKPKVNETFKEDEDLQAGENSSLVRGRIPTADATDWNLKEVDGEPTAR